MMRGSFDANLIIFICFTKTKITGINWFVHVTTGQFGYSVNIDQLQESAIDCALQVNIPCLFQFHISYHYVTLKLSNVELR